MKNYILIVCIFIFVGCGGSSSSPDSKNSKDPKETTKKNPSDASVTATVPEANSTHIKGDNITITFSKEMQETTVNSNKNIKLKKKSDGSEISTVVTYDNSTKTVTINPSNDLDADNYEVSVSKGVKDKDGDALSSTYKLAVKTYVEDTNGLKYALVKSPHTSKIWLDRNLGASEVCDTTTKSRSTYGSDSSYTIGNKNCFGGLFQWGRLLDGHQIVDFETDANNTNEVAYNASFTTATTDTVTVNAANSSKFIMANGAGLLSDWAAAADADGAIRKIQWSKTDGTFCPVGFRVPTKNELKADTSDVMTFSGSSYESET